MINQTAFIFPGQGSQEVGMGKAIAEKYAAAREIFAQADDILGFSLSRLCFEGPEIELNDTINTQVAIFVTSMATWEALKEEGCPLPAFVAGHSLGEYSAYVMAGVLDFADGVRLVRERGRLMQEVGRTNPGGMAAILHLDDEVVQEICRTVEAEGHGTLQIANYNAPGQVVVSGHEAAIEHGMALAKEAKSRRVVRLAVSVAPHSALMGVIAPDFRKIISQTTLRLPDIPIIANINGQPLHTIDDIRQEMENQLTASVCWTATIHYIVEQGITDFVEIGPKKVLTSLLKRIDKRAKGQSIQTPDDIVEFLGKR